VETVFLKLIKW